MPSVPLPPKESNLFKRILVSPGPRPRRLCLAWGLGLPRRCHRRVVQRLGPPPLLGPPDLTARAVTPGVSSEGDLTPVFSAPPVTTCLGLFGSEGAGQARPEQSCGVRKSVTFVSGPPITQQCRGETIGSSPVPCAAKSEIGVTPRK